MTYACSVSSVAVMSAVQHGTGCIVIDTTVKAGVFYCLLMIV